MKNRKKEITLLVIAILVIVSMIAGATYAFFKAQIGPASNFDINATTGTTDNLTFSTEGDIVLNVTAENLKKSGGDLSDTAIARARLIKSNTSESATANYNIYLLIEENEMEYSSYTKEGQPNLIFMTKEKKEEANLEGYTGVPELILSVKKGETEYNIEKRLTPTTGGYDITEADGLYAIGENIEIISDGDVTDEWEVKVTFKNLEYNQQLNTGKSLKGKIIITAEKLLYEINNADELRQLSSEVNNGDSKEGKYYVLTGNIDLGIHEEGVSNFTPIGTETNRFQGNFNGDNHSISNLYINNSINDNIGLFGVVENANINNTTLNGKIESRIVANIGGLVGTSYGNIIIKNIINNITIITTSNNNFMGGLIGNAEEGFLTVIKSVNYGSINGSHYVGGLIGQTKVPTIMEDCYNDGKVIVENKIGSNSIGGIIGVAKNKIELKNCFNDAEISDNVNYVYPSYVEYNYTGGLVGQLAVIDLTKISVISFSYNAKTGIINGMMSGGLIGLISNQTKIIIDKCYNMGDVVASNGIIQGYNNRIGGLVGYNSVLGYLYILNSYNMGNLFNNFNSSNTMRRDVGSFIGQNWASHSYILNSYNKGNLSSLNNVGNVFGLSGYDESFPTYKSLFYINNVYLIGELIGTQKNTLGILTPI